MAPSSTTQSWGSSGIVKLNKKALTFTTWAEAIFGRFYTGQRSFSILLAYIENVTESQFGRKLKITTIDPTDGRQTFYLPTAFNSRLISRIRTLAPADPPPYHPRGFKPVGPLVFAPLPKIYLPSSIGVILFIGLWMVSPEWALLALIPALHFSAVCMYRLELRHGRLIYNTWHHKYNVKQSDITASFFADRGKGWHVIIVRNEDVLRIPCHIFPPECYEALLSFDSSPEYDPLKFSTETWQYFG